MRKWILTLALVLLVAANVQAQSLQDRLAGLLGIEPQRQVVKPLEGVEDEAASGFTLWLLGTPTELDSPDAEFSARAGWETDGVEFGVQVDAVGFTGENYESWGLYVLMHIMTTVPWTGEPGEFGYVGYTASIMDQNEVVYGPVAGMIIGGVVLEYRYRDVAASGGRDDAGDRHQVFTGPMLRF